jgi:hypothetical protein
MVNMGSSAMVDDLGPLEHEVERLLVPLPVPKAFAEHLRSGLMASAPGQESIVRVRRRLRWGLALAAIGGALTGLWLAIFLGRRDGRAAVG